MGVGQPYKQGSWNETWDAVVIGSGIGGLTAAVLLARHGGKRVLVLERHYVAGGFTHTFRRPGYEWDVGVHYIGEVTDPGSPIRAAFDHLTEGRLKWNPMPDVYDRILIGGREYDFPSGRNRFRDRMKAYFPRESAAIDRYIAEVEAAANASGRYFASKAIPGPIARFAAPLMQKGFLHYSDRTTAEVLGSITTNPELIAVLTGQWGDYGLPPSQSSFGMHALVARHYFGGAAYPVGGASQIAASIAPVIEQAGGRIAVGAEVSKILTDSGSRAVGVRMADGREFRAKTIVSDAGAINTFTSLLDPESTDVHASLRTIPPSMSHVSLYVGVRGSLDIEPSNLWIYPGTDHDAALARFMDDPSQPFPLLFISFPSAKDPTFGERYPGRSTIEVVAPMPYGPFERWEATRWKKRGDDYAELKQNLARRLQDQLEQHVPAVRGRIDCAELSTPLTTRHFANHPHGEIYGLSAVPSRFRIAGLGPRTQIRNLYLTGADVATPGVTGALFGGVMCASAILRRNLVSEVTAPVAYAA